MSQRNLRRGPPGARNPLQNTRPLRLEPRLHFVSVNRTRQAGYAEGRKCSRQHRRSQRGFAGALAAVLLGNRKLIDNSGVEPEALAEDVEAMRPDGQPVMFVAVNGNVAGLIGVDGR